MHRRRFLQAGTAASLSALTPLPGFAASQGLFVPAEEEPHELTLMQWPNSRAVYRDAEFLADTQATIAEIANTISEFEPVILLAPGELHGEARRQLSSAVTLWDIPTEDLWARDSGPLIAFDEKQDRVVSHIQFNGWGDKQVHDADGQVALRVAERLGFPVISSGLFGEAGGVEHDGHGLLMAHESSWIPANRNPGLRLDEIDRRLREAYGAETVIWTPGVQDLDITDYHIDSLARFTGPGRVFINLPQYPDTDDPFHHAAQETYDALTHAGLDVTIVPEPEVRRVDSLDFVASYANYYACNGAIIAADFGDSNADAYAAQTLAQHYPGREIVTLNVDELGELGGGIHCATQQVPA